MKTTGSRVTGSRPSPRARQRDKIVLIVDDDETTRLVLQRGLSQAGCWHSPSTTAERYGRYVVPDRRVSLDDYPGKRFELWSSTPAVLWTANRPQEKGIQCPRLRRGQANRGRHLR